MKLEPFKLERYFVPYEFSAKYLLCASDCDGVRQTDLLSLADDETKQMWEKLSLGYTETQGHPILRSEVAKLYPGISDKQVLILAPEEGVFIAMNSILSSGDHVITTFPSYQSLSQIAKGIGCEITAWEHNEAGRWALDVDFLERNIKKNTKLLVINFPNNPTGYIPPKNDFLRIIEIARKHNLYIFSDEMYRFLEYKNEDRLPSICEVYEKGVTLFGMTKTFGMAGLRIGWLITKDTDLFQKMAEFKDYTTICSSAPSEILALIGLGARDLIIKTNLEVINTNLKILDNFFIRHQKLFEWIKPFAGPIGFPKIKFNTKADEFCKKLVEDVGVMLLPSTVYGYENNHFRISFGRKNMPEALDVFEKYLENL